MFKEIHRLKYDVMFLQETYCKDESGNKQIWSNEWGGKMYFNCGESNARGVLILVSNKLHHRTCEIINDGEGRIIGIQMNVNEQRWLLVNLYAPNVDNPGFFQNLFKTIYETPHDYLILGGDFNLVLNPTLDAHNRKYNNNKALKIVNEYMEDKDMCDIWRVQHDDKQRYTCFKRHRAGSIASRIDYFLVSQGVANLIGDSEIISNVHSDHNSIALTLNVDNEKRGPGIWRLNTSLLESDEVKMKVDEKIEYCKKLLHLDMFERWEYMKDEVSALYQKEGIERQKKSCIVGIEVPGCNGNLRK